MKFGETLTKMKKIPNTFIPDLLVIISLIFLTVFAAHTIIKINVDIEKLEKLNQKMNEK